MAIEALSSNIPAYNGDVAKHTVKTTNVNTGYSDSVSQNVPVGQTQPVSKPMTDMNQQDSENGQGQQSKEGKLSDKTISNAVKDTNSKLHVTNTKCEFSYHEDTKRISITIRDKNTDEIIKEIPPEKSLEMVAKMWELAGILVDEKR